MHVDRERASGEPSGFRAAQRAQLNQHLAAALCKPLQAARQSRRLQLSWAGHQRPDSGGSGGASDGQSEDPHEFCERQDSYGFFPGA